VSVNPTTGITLTWLDRLIEVRRLEHYDPWLGFASPCWYVNQTSSMLHAPVLF